MARLIRSGELGAACFARVAGVNANLLRMPRAISARLSKQAARCMPAMRNLKKKVVAREAALTAAAGDVLQGITPHSRFELLEARQMLTSVSLSSGLLTVTGNSTSNNKLTVTLDSTGNIKAYANGTTHTYSKSSVSSIKIIGGGSGDYLAVTNLLNVKTTFDAKGGNDTVWAGA